MRAFVLALLERYPRIDGLVNTVGGIIGARRVAEEGHELILQVNCVEKMKDAMWAVDPAYRVRYRDPRDPDQMTLDIGNWSGCCGA